MRAVSLTILALLALAAEARAECRFSGYPIRYGINVTYSGPCDAEGASISFTAGPLIESLQFVQLPRHGKADLRGLAAAGYLPKPGYHGPDRFVLRICGTDPVAKGCSNVTFDVTVK